MGANEGSNEGVRVGRVGWAVDGLKVCEIVGSMDMVGRCVGSMAGSFVGTSLGS